jgi:diacylglycerol kinase family enzyme
VKIHSPVGRIHAAAVELAPRPGTLRGKLVVVLDNGKQNAAAVLRAVVEDLQRRGALDRVRWLEKNFPAEPMHHADEVFAGCDAIINGVGH